MDWHTPKEAMSSDPPFGLVAIRQVPKPVNSCKWRDKYRGDFCGVREHTEKCSNSPKHASTRSLSGEIQTHTHGENTARCIVRSLYKDLRSIGSPSSFIAEEGTIAL